MQFNNYNLFKSNFSQWRVSAAAIESIFRVKLLQEYKNAVNFVVITIEIITIEKVVIISLKIT